MRQIALRSLIFLVAAACSVQLADACYICGGGGGGGYPSCQVTGLGAEDCATLPDPPYCQTFFNDCCNDGGGGCGCTPCDGGCCASLKNGQKSSCPTLKRMALQEVPIQPGPDKPNHVKEFLAMVESGKFDGQTVYMDASGTLAKGILNIPLDYWKSFTQKVVMKGWQKDPRLDPRVQHNGEPQILLEVETKTGHKFVIHLITDSEIKRVLSEPQPQ
jgi:hypothetical protein